MARLVVSLNLNNDDVVILHSLIFKNTKSIKVDTTNDVPLASMICKWQNTIRPIYFLFFERVGSNFAYDYWEGVCLNVFTLISIEQSLSHIYMVVKCWSSVWCFKMLLKQVLHLFQCVSWFQVFFLRYLNCETLPLYWSSGSVNILILHKITNV